MIYERNTRHFTRPKKILKVEDKKAHTYEFERYPFLRTSTGWFCCRRGCRENHDISEKLGLGISLYFKQLKSLTVIFLIFTLLSLPALILYRDGNEASKVSSKMFGSQSYFLTYTLGNLG